MGKQGHGHNEYRGTEAQWAKRDTVISGYVQGQWAQQFKRDSSCRQWAERYSGNTGTVKRATQGTVGTRNRLHRETVRTLDAVGTLDTVRTLDTVGAENNGHRGHDSLQWTRTCLSIIFPLTHSICWSSFFTMCIRLLI